MQTFSVQNEHTQLKCSVSCFISWDVAGIALKTLTWPSLFYWFCHSVRKWSWIYWTPKSLFCICLFAVSSGDLLPGPGVRCRLRNTHKWKFLPIWTNQHTWKLSFSMRVSLLSCQSPVNHCGGTETNNLPPRGGVPCEDQRACAGRWVGPQQGQVWAESISGGATACKTLHPRRGAARQSDEETTLRGGKRL